jgi:hypothetical protein
MSINIKCQFLIPQNHIIFYNYIIFLKGISFLWVRNVIGSKQFLNRPKIFLNKFWEKLTPLTPWAKPNKNQIKVFFYTNPNYPDSELYSKNNTTKCLQCNGRILLWCDMLLLFKSKFCNFFLMSCYQWNRQRI